MRLINDDFDFLTSIVFLLFDIPFASGFRSKQATEILRRQRENNFSFVLQAIFISAEIFTVFTQQLRSQLISVMFLCACSVWSH